MNTANSQGVNLNGLFAWIMARRWTLSVLLLGMLVLGACSGGTDTWPGITSQAETSTIIVSYKESVTSLDGSERDRNWIYTYDGARFYAPALITEDTVYVGDFDGRFHAIDRADGSARWVYAPDRPSFLFVEFGSNDRVIAGAAYGDGKVFFGTEAGVFALDAGGDSADIIWQFEDTEHSVWARPLYIEGPTPLLIVGSLDKHLYALNPDNGDLIWERELNGAIPSAPLYDAERGLLYVGTLNSTLYAVDLTGEVVGDYSTDGWVWSAPVMDGDTLYFGDLSGWLYAVQLTDEGFIELWKKEISQEALRATPVLVDGVLIVASEDKKIYAVNIEDQSIKWTNDDFDQKFLTDIMAVEIEDEPAVIVGTQEDDRMLIALRVSDGKSLWEYKYTKGD